MDRYKGDESSDGTPRGQDDRFYTPRESARLSARGSSGGSSENETWVTPRSGRVGWASDEGESYATPREYHPHSGRRPEPPAPHPHAHHPHIAEEKYGGSGQQQQLAYHPGSSAKAAGYPPDTATAATAEHPYHHHSHPTGGSHPQPHHAYQPPRSSQLRRHYQSQMDEKHAYQHAVPEEGDYDYDAAAAAGEHYAPPPGYPPVYPPGYPPPQQASFYGGDYPLSSAAMPKEDVYPQRPHGAENQYHPVLVRAVSAPAGSSSRNGGGGGGDDDDDDGMVQAVEDIFSYARHNRVDEIERLLDRGVPVNARDANGNTILCVSCQNGNKRVAKAALRRGADINAKNYRGNTPLHFCFTYGYGDTLGQYLIDKGADPAIRNSSGLTCYEGIGAR